MISEWNIPLFTLGDSSENLFLKTGLTQYLMEIKIGFTQFLMGIYKISPM